MANGDDIAPPPTPNPAYTPWDFVDGLFPGMARADAPAPMQPGLGVPAAALDGAVPAFGPQLPPSVSQQIDALAPDVPPPPSVGEQIDAIGDKADQAAALPPPVPLFGPPRPTLGDQLMPVATEPAPSRATPADVGTAPTDLNGKALDTGLESTKDRNDEPPSPFEGMSDAQVAQFAVQHPVEFAAMKTGWEQAQATHFARKQLELADNYRRADEAALAERKAADAATQAQMAALNQRAEQFANTKTDQNRYLHGRSTLARIADFVGAIAGGVAAGQPGGNGINQYVAGLQKEIDRDLDAQKADIENGWKGIGARRSALADEFARTGNLYQAQQTVRLASYQAARNDLLAQQQLYDPAGRRGFAIGQAVQDMNGRIASTQQKLAEETLKSQLDIAKAQREAAQQAETERHQRQDEKNAAANTQIAGWGKAIEAQNNKANQAAKTRELDIAEAKAQDERTKATIDKDQKFSVSAPTAASNGASAPLVNRDGTVWHARDEKTAGEISKSIAAAADYNRLTNSMIRGIAEHGGESDYLKSEDWQRMKVQQQEAVAQLHEAYNIQSFRETTAEFFEKMATAGVDPTSFVRNATAALKQSNSDLQAKINARLDSEGYHGDKIRFEDTSSPPPAKVTVDDIRVKQALRESPSDAALDNAYGAWLKTWTAEHGGNSNLRVEYGSDAAAAKTARSTFDANYRERRILPHTEATINDLAKVMQTGDQEARDRAEQNLAKIASDGPNGDTRDYAQSKLNSARAPKPGGP